MRGLRFLIFLKIILIKISLFKNLNPKISSIYEISPLKLSMVETLGKNSSFFHFENNSF
jgi:hypothetical protein